MIDYTKWKQVNKAATTLHLDHRNPRLLPRATLPTQPELVAELIKHEDIYAMAKSIVDHGFYPHELVIGVEEQGKMIVIEGNRRLCAVKLLISPTLAPDGDRARFRKLSHKANISQIRKLPLVIAPSRDAASPLIQSRHTRTQVEKWSPVMQARFYADRVSDGNSVDELATEFSIPPGQIREFLQNYQMYCVACSLTLPPGAAEKVRDPREFPLTNLERIYRNADAASFLGISFDAKGELKGSIPVEEFKRAFGKVVADVALGAANSRQLNTKKEFADYISGFGAAAPDRSKKGSFTAKEILGSSAKTQALPKPAPTPPPKPAPQHRGLVSKTFVCGIEDVRINAVLKELKKLSVDDYANAVALTLRGFLDIVVGDYCDRLGATKPLIAKLDKKSEKPADWFPTVRQILNYFINEENRLSLHPLALKASKMLVNDQSGVSILMLDAFAHNKWVIPTAPELRSFWAKVEEAIKAMLTPIPPKPSV
jgi:hypothetical protein